MTASENIILSMDASGQKIDNKKEKAIELMESVGLKESYANLDKQTEAEILDIFKRLAHEENKCVIIVTHSPNVCDAVDEVYDLKKVK